MKTKLLGIVALVLVLVGCTNAKTITEEEAKKKALAIQDGEVVATESDLKDDDPSYTFTIKTADMMYEIEIDAVSGDVISQESDVIPVQEPAQVHAVSQSDAEATALNKVPGATIVKSELDHENTHVGCKFEIELRKDNMEYNVDVDAQTGTIVAYDEDRE